MSLFKPTGPQWYRRAQKVTPNGCQTMSRSKRWFMPSKTILVPSHYRATVGACYVLDADTNVKYLDLVGGLGAVTLGFDRAEVRDSVVDAVSVVGAGATLPSVYEVRVAERLAKLIPCAEMIRFVKTGSEACSGVIRIARMATGKSKIVSNGYHGWHDQFASTMEFAPGVPVELSQVMVSVPYGDEQALAMVLKQGDVAAVIIEPARGGCDSPNYLAAARALCTAHNALLIFDEVLCGFRWAVAGGQEYFGVLPDLAVYGKALANGFPLACIAGPEKLMRHAWVVSGTHNGDIVGLAACEGVLDVYQKEDVITRLWDVGWMLTSTFKDTIARYSLPLNLVGEGVHFHLEVLPTAPPYFLERFVWKMAEVGVLLHPHSINSNAGMKPRDVELLAIRLDKAMMDGRGWRHEWWDWQRPMVNDPFPTPRVLWAETTVEGTDMVDGVKDAEQRG